MRMDAASPTKSRARRRHSTSSSRAIARGVVKSKRSKMVSFERQVNVHKIRSWREMGPASCAALWLQQVDYKRINEEKGAIINMIKLGQLEHDANGPCCTRGLEHHSPKPLHQAEGEHQQRQQQPQLRRQDIRKKSIQAVLKEQSTQREAKKNQMAVVDGVEGVEEEAVAEVYREVCTRSKHAAQQLGMQDEKEAQAIAKEGIHLLPMPGALPLSPTPPPMYDRRTRRGRRSSLNLQRYSPPKPTPKGLNGATSPTGRPRFNSLPVTNSNRPVVPTTPTERHLTVNFDTHVDYIFDVIDQAATQEVTTTANELWYSNDEIKKMRQERKVIVQKAASSNIYNVVDSSGDEDQRMLLRGFENMIGDNGRASKYNQLKSKAAVLEEQRRQQQMGIYDPTKLSRVYQVTTERCVKNAYELGLNDERVIQDMLFVERRRQQQFRQMHQYPHSHPHPTEKSGIVQGSIQNSSSSRRVASHYKVDRETGRSPYL